MWVERDEHDVRKSRRDGRDEGGEPPAGRNDIHIRTPAATEYASSHAVDRRIRRPAPAGCRPRARIAWMASPPRAARRR